MEKETKWLIGGGIIFVIFALLYTTGAIRFSVYDTIPGKPLEPEKLLGTAPYSDGGCPSPGYNYEDTCPLFTGDGKAVDYCHYRVICPAASGPDADIIAGGIFRFCHSNGYCVTNREVYRTLMTKHYCANGICESDSPYNENCENCESDCGKCPVIIYQGYVIENGKCVYKESTTSFEGYATREECEKALPTPIIGLLPLPIQQNMLPIALVAFLSVVLIVLLVFVKAKR